MNTKLAYDLGAKIAKEKFDPKHVPFVEKEIAPTKDDGKSVQRFSRIYGTETHPEAKPATKPIADIRENLVRIFKTTPVVTDDIIHAEAEKAGMNPHEFEEEIYKMLKEYITAKE